MPLVKCPCCGHTFHSDGHEVVPLSPNALLLLSKAPERVKRGQVWTFREIYALTGLSVYSIYRALSELRRAGYFATVPYRGTRRQYVGVPSQLLTESMRRLTA